MTKHLEIKTYDYYNIKVIVKIDYDEGTISLMESTSSKSLENYKKYVFATRGLEFMNSWLNILDGMKHAIEMARTELEEYKKIKEKEKMDEVTNVLMEATGIVKKKEIIRQKRAIKKK